CTCARTSLQIDYTPGNRYDPRELIYVDRGRLIVSPQLPLSIPTFVQNGQPGVLLEVEAAFGDHIAFTRSESCLHHPNPVELPPDLVGIPILRSDPNHVRVLWRQIELVTVVRNVHLLFAEQLPVILLNRPVEYPALVEELLPGGYEVRSVEGDGRRTPHPALSDKILPARAPYAVHIHRIPSKNGFPILEWRRRLYLPELTVETLKVFQ